MKKIVIAFLTLALLAGTHAAQAKESIAAIGIAGPGIQRELILSDRNSLDRFADGWWWLIGFRYGSNETPKPIATPLRLVGPAYTITRYQQVGNRRVAFDRLHYYPSAIGGVTFFDGHLMQGYQSEFDGKWFRSTDAGDAVMREVFVRYRVNVPAMKSALAKER